MKGKHNATNGIFLPNSADNAIKFGGFSIFHNGSHEDYSNLVRNRIKEIRANYQVHQDVISKF